MLGIRDDRGGHSDAHQNNLALWWLIISPACLPMLWPCSVKCMFHSLSSLPLICVVPFFCFFAFIFLSSGGNKSILTLLSSLHLFLFLICRPSTKTICFWRKEISTSTHSLPGKPIPMHTSPTSTPMMTIDPRLHDTAETLTLLSILTIFFSLCFVLRFVTPCVGLSRSETLWQLVCNENTDTQRCQQREMPTFSQVPWVHLESSVAGGISCLDLHWEMDKLIS